MYHDHIGPIWNKGDHIPPTLLALSGHELKVAKKQLISIGILDDYIAVVPGAAWKQKQWSAKKYIDTLKQLDMPVVLVGGIMIRYAKKFVMVEKVREFGWQDRLENRWQLAQKHYRK